MVRQHVPDVVPDDATDEQIRSRYGDDADEIIAFRRFLRLPRTEPDDAFPRGRVVCPPHWQQWGRREIDAKEVLRRDEASRGKR